MTHQYTEEDGMATERDAERTEAPTHNPEVTFTRDAAIAFARELGRTPEVADALADAVAARVGMIPTASEVARAIREYDHEHGVPASADRTEGHPVNPEDGLS